MLKPSKLQPGDTVAIVSPSWGGAGAFPHRVERGVACLQALGFNFRLAPHALSQRGYVSDTPENRAADIHEVFRDPGVKAIVAAIGGDHSCHLLPLLDFDLIRANPKVFMGYSDITVLNVAIWKATELVTFNGPALITDFAEYPEMFEYTKEHFLRTVNVAEPAGAIEPSPWWTEELLDWEQKKDLEQPRTRQPSEGWTWLKPGIAQGRLIGGCIESLQHLRGTRFWPGPDDWRGAIFFFETSEDKPSPATVDGILMDYENMGILEQLGGMLVGRPMFYSDEEREALRQVVAERTRRYSFPIITDMDFGHTAPQFTLPIGCQARIDTEARRFEIVEAAVE
jgi:muramoyltetrapeptide carboxypeptidase LdcA involved in peptidoglycan recycling